MPGAARSWHPLAYHSLDVAAALGALLDLRPAWLHAMAAALGVDAAACRLRLLLAAALHDIGKFAENFQQKVPDLQRALLVEVGRQPVPCPASDGHGDIGQGLWRPLAKPRGLLPLTPWVLAAVAHHGAPTVSATPNNAIRPPSLDDAGACVDAVVALLGRPDFADPMPEEMGAEVWRVAGLVILADWIGSNQAWFPYAPPDLALPAYWDRARHQARLAVRAADLAEAPIAARVLLADLLPGSDATPLQQQAEREPSPDGPTLYIVEDLTGAGKTEAALLLAHRLMADGRAEGLYWALPTMATANGLYRRLADSHHCLFRQTGQGGRPSLVLAHSARDLNTAFQLSIAAPGRADYADAPNAADQDRSAEAHCAAFIADDAKKTFLAQVGVGTLDQALLAVLPVRHQALRLAALSRRVLVVDEAHSYDPYMNRALEQLLRFHGRLGGSAVVLSATLTAAQRQGLVNAYAGRTVALSRQDFPLLTRVRAGAAVEVPVASGRGTRRDLPVRRLDTAEAAMAALLDAAAQGHCAVYIRNTVRDALAAVDHLRRHAAQARGGAGVAVDLFHARYCLGDRLAREGAALDRFGKASTPAARRGRILVATQVVEQSLDLDFDFMATDLAPMDLLIQRAGRLHRHARPGRPPPELWVVGPPAVPDAPATWYQTPFPYAAKVYPDAVQLWLTQRTLDALGGLPLDSRSPRALIEPVFGATGAEGAPAVSAALARVGETAAGQRSAERGIARLNTLDPDRFDRGAAAWDSDIETPTRLGDPTLTLRLARWHDGHLTPWWQDAPGTGTIADPVPAGRTWRLSELTVRAGLLEVPLAPDAQAQAAIDAVRTRWPEDAPPILALTPAPDAPPDQDLWTGRWRDRQGHEQTVLYDAATGLRVP